MIPDQLFQQAARMPLPPLCPPVGARALIEACREPGQPKRLEPLQVYNRRQILRHALLCISVALAKGAPVPSTTRTCWRTITAASTATSSRTDGESADWPCATDTGAQQYQRQELHERAHRVPRSKDARRAARA